MNAPQQKIYLSIPNLGILCAAFLLVVMIHAIIVVPMIVRRTDSTLARALDASLANQNRILKRLEERFDRVEVLLMKESR